MIICDVKTPGALGEKFTENCIDSPGLSTTGSGGNPLIENGGLGNWKLETIRSASPAF
jgi:hypothetical protein